MEGDFGNRELQQRMRADAAAQFGQFLASDPKVQHCVQYWKSQHHSWTPEFFPNLFNVPGNLLDAKMILNAFVTDLTTRPSVTEAPDPTFFYRSVTEAVVASRPRRKTVGDVEVFLQSVRRQGIQTPSRRWALPSPKDHFDLHPQAIIQAIESGTPLRKETFISLANQLGRLSVPLAERVEGAELQPIPELALFSVNVLADRARLSAQWSEFNPSRAEHEPITEEELRQQLVSAYMDSWTSEKPGFFWLFSERVFTDEAQRAYSWARNRYREMSIAAIEDQYGLLIGAAHKLGRKERQPLYDKESPMPPAQPYGVSPRGAEIWVRDAIRALGVPEAEVTQASRDGGVDIVTDDWAVSVKHYAGSVGVPEVREIFGVAVHMHRGAMLWTSGTLTADALSFAEAAPVLVFHYDVATARVNGVTDAAKQLLARGSLRLMSP